MYMEYIDNVPPTVRIFIEGPDESYVIHGYHKLAISTNLMVNELTIKNNSSYKLIIKDSNDDDVYEWNLPNVYILNNKIC